MSIHSSSLPALSASSALPILLDGLPWFTLKIFQ